MRRPPEPPRARAGPLRRAAQRRLLLGSTLVVAALVSACANLGGGSKLRVYQSEKFELDQSFSRLFDSSAADTCEAARRALLSQGYLLADTPVRPGVIQARKHFQPEGEVHVQIEFHVSCVSEGPVSTAFVSAIQEQYVLRRSSTSASVGVSAIGSVSIPLGSTGDALVKVGSMTIPAGSFYDRFFVLMERFLREQGTEPAASR